MRLLLLFFMLTFSSGVFAQRMEATSHRFGEDETRLCVDLSGKWEFEMDSESKLNAKSKFRDVIDLPGSMPERGKGYKPTVRTEWTGSLYDSSFFFNPYMKKYRTDDNLKLPFFLTPDRHYVGDAWYRRSLVVPSEFSGKRIVVYLERPHIISTLYINNKEVGSDNSLSVAHVYDVTDFVKPGKKAVICIKINNDADKVGVGKDSHSVTDQTQGNWNGIVGRMELRALPKLCIQGVKLTPNAKLGTVDVDIEVKNPDGLAYNVQCATTDGTFLVNLTSTTAAQGQQTLHSSIKATKEVRKWDEFSPYLYYMDIVLESQTKEKDSVRVSFGMRDICTQGKDILVNGRPTMMRGTVENCCFPLTGYPPTDKASWMAVLQQCKRYGLNHIRFHSYCPPEAAFEAADELGFYLQPEGPSWPNHGIKLGNGMMIDDYLMKETQRMVEQYGNHPSFCMLSSGNEPAGNWVKWVSGFVDYWKAADPRRIYTGASVGGSWAWQPKNEYHVKAGARGLNDWAKTEPGSMTDFRSNIDTVGQPFISHETGQWCAFPDLDESSQYTGVYKGKNFEIFRDIMQDNGMEIRARDFLKASGQLQALCYKYEIEKTMRTPHYAGFQLLGLNDYSGQGTALVGPLNVFWREKGYVDSTAWREWCAPVVVLARLPKFTYFSGDSIAYSLEAVNYGSEEIKEAKLRVQFVDATGKMLAQHVVEGKDVPLGGCNALENYIDCFDVTEPLQLTLLAEISGKAGDQDIMASNRWNVWVYPRHTNEELDAFASTYANEVYFCKGMPEEGALRCLERGGTVVVLGNAITYGKGIQQYYTPVFWNTSWFKMKPPHTTGMYIEQHHPLFRHFPTSDFSDLQWWALMNRQPVMLLDQFPKAFQPIVQPIDTWFLSRKLGMLFEARVGKGKLLMSSMPFDLQSSYPAVQQMSYAIMQYVHSDEFNPQQEVDFKLVQKLFTEQTPAVNMFTNDSPDELKKGVR